MDFFTVKYDFDKNTVIDTIGFNGPLLTSSVTAMHLIRRVPYLLAFLAGAWLNLQLNELLKEAIKEPRPTGGKNFADEKYAGAQQYGMPSGHAQMAFFALTFLYLVKKSKPWLILTLFIAALTLYQRFQSRKHTIKQLLFGACVGSSFAFLCFYMVKQILRTKTNNLLV